ncbi:hypothetical protein FNF27_06703 [Cafeteria roenbergensis]|uniref:DNA-directed RNA polymerases I and III subunit RPAC1 n=1 Tax=Cafeteria roenbergensis TaxID=33653 RepID=A0A5A8E2J9_CAFRO|nr:hypothetical protein FNF29_02560 [Cafeteria roenbergensis]KAA0159556.1 hypothetical protein FNF31_04795 [Cafeteria roenbergensis]KAA0159760.1 hypothetical protein FNF28_05723 [Cafeteria roenbergensis]KAA0170111.1 hypothetical protein FNF27_06703 [Cafeteria roenbergensis]|eukprot:KAA0154340.1 hypothetical protein FNF29_02560 [Cafeteria roenbergensis]
MAASGLLKPVKTEIGRSGTSLVYEPGAPDGDFLGQLDEKLDIQVTTLTDEECEFELKGVSAAIANAIRRILISEVPSMAIETVFMHNNTSIIQDEVLSHRLGLIPIRADPREFDWPSEAAGATDLNTLVFGLDVTGVEAPPSKRDGGAGDRLTHVYSRDITWGPQGGQEERFADRPVEPVEGDIVLAKLLPGQTICLEAHAVKGTGADHAKFSPVATASYRLAPEVELPGEGFVGDDARSLVATCPMGVFDIEDVGSSTGPRAVVAQPRACTMCRECLRPAGWAQRVRLRKVNDHFLFRVESTGALPAATLVEMALEIFAEKARNAKEALEAAVAAASGVPAGIEVAAGGIGAAAASAGGVFAVGAGDDADIDDDGGAIAAGTGADDADAAAAGSSSSSSSSSSSAKQPKKRKGGRRKGKADADE